VNDLIDNTPAGAEPGRDILQPFGPTSCWRKLLKIEERLFTERNLRLYGSGVVVAVVVATILAWRGSVRSDWVVTHDGAIGTIDFCWIWVSSKFAVSNDPTAIYNPAAVTALYDEVFDPGECLFRQQQYIYPPTFLFFIYPLGFMPYLAAYALWAAATLFLYEVAIYAIVPRPVALIAALAPFAVIKNIQLGHNGLLSAGLIGLSLVFVEHRPWLSGVFLGLFTYKPQLGVLFPLALLVSRNWRAFASAAAASLVFGIAAAVAFGHQGWPSFVATLANGISGLSPVVGIHMTLESVYGILSRIGVSERLAGMAHAVVAVLVAVWLWTVWAKPVPYALKAAILCTASVVVTPYVLHYDLCVLSISVAFLVGDGLARGFLPGERMLMLACFLGLFVIAEPVGPAICAVLLCLAARRFAAWQSEGAAASLAAA
jgi:arabinofuranan 3-O-arabinosyltransferase